MPEGYEEGTYLHEFTEAAPEKQNPDAGEIAAGTIVGGVGSGLALVVGTLGLLITLWFFPLGLCIGIPLFILAAYLISCTGTILQGEIKSRTYLRGECPYCGYMREPEPLTGDKVRCKRCKNIILVKGTRFFVTDSKLKKFRKKNPAPSTHV